MKERTHLLVLPDYSQQPSHLDLLGLDAVLRTQETKFDLVCFGRRLGDIFSPPTAGRTGPNTGDSQGVRDAVVVNVDRISRQ